ncbi:hypothetical protein B0H67DRAFT_641501 [Lasiosphaeris hirsuta]|uniref:Methylthioribose-1-phosphate isomerase n=1 Tax=Lasiosphaeris hirsuta TaxID=260670 RepID=A0AA40AZT1_9PEZI|nr:hypothetical protein B0H67DRAFT_641501 [Lasiosphaeris hirsuta]
MATLEAIKYSRGSLLVLDQLRLPHEHHYDVVSTSEEAFDCIRSMRVRGAPAIAIVAALAHAVELRNGSCTATSPDDTLAYIDSRLDYLRESRPTAVDLFNAIALLKAAVRTAQIEGLGHPEAKDAILRAYIEAAEAILAKDLENNMAIGAYGAAWLQQQYNASADRPLSVLTHCNTGSLATSGHGTALGIIRSLYSQGLLKHAYCTETRPYNQGSRLTSFELVYEGIPSTLITDSMAGALFALRRDAMHIGAVIVGADRVVRNGDTANKIGTYTLAVLARHHGVKFVVAAPTTSIDLETETGAGIHVEERKREELTQISGAVVNADGSVDASKTARVAIADQRIGVWNPAFDVTPHALIDAIVTEKGAVVKGANGKFDFSTVMPERWAAIVDNNPLLLLLHIALSAQGLFFPHPQQQQPILAGPPDHSSSSPPPYRNALLSLHKSLIDIPSLSGNEHPAALFLQTYLTAHNYTVTLQHVAAAADTPANAPRFNVLAWPGSPPSAGGPAPSRSPRVLVTSHIDVVPPYIPYSSSAADDGEEVTGDTVIRGRGSVDAKGSVAAQITAVGELVAAGTVRAEDVMLLFVVGEETSGDGMKAFSAEFLQGREGAGFEAAVFGEPTENRLACGHKGIFGGTVYVQGKAGHSGYPWLGKSATGLLIKGLEAVFEADLGSSERFGNTTVNVGRIAGGVAANVIAKEASALLAVRVGAGDFETGAVNIEKKIEKILSDLDDEAFTVQWSHGYGPVECDCDIAGFETVITNYGTDVPNLKGDHASYLYGPGTILLAHGDDEALRVRDLEEAVEGYKKIIQHVLKK